MQTKERILSIASDTPKFTETVGKFNEKKEEQHNIQMKRNGIMWPIYAIN